MFLKKIKAEGDRWVELEKLEPEESARQRLLPDYRSHVTSTLLELRLYLRSQVSRVDVQGAAKATAGRAKLEA